MANNFAQLTDRLPRLTISRNWQWLGCAGLAVLCVLAMVNLSMLLVTEPVTPDVRFPRVSSPRTAANVQLYPESGTGAVVEDSLAEASFDARLLGVIYRDNHSLASIAIKGGREKVYKVGDSLAGGVTLEQIEPHRVVVRERGILKQISLKSLLESDTPIQRRQPVVTDSALPPVVATPILGEQGISGLRVDQLNLDIEEQDLVQQGDLVVAVDGVGLSTLLADQAAIGQLADREALTLTIIRNGREVSVDINGDIIRALMNSY